MTLHQIEYDCKCKACSGTGLYIGMGERGGASVVCYCCDGTGKQHIETTYESFEARETHPLAQWVYQINPGICMGKGEELEFTDFGGMSYADWQDGKSFKAGAEDRLHTCPAWFYQCLDSDKKPDWAICNNTCGQTFEQCPSFANKWACWKRWDKEFSIHSEELKT